MTTTHESEAQRRYLAAPLPTNDDEQAAYDELEAAVLAKVGLTPDDGRRITEIKMETGKCWRCVPDRLARIDYEILDHARDIMQSGVPFSAEHLGMSEDASGRRLMVLLDSAAAHEYDDNLIDVLRAARDASTPRPRRWHDYSGAIVALGAESPF
ncbi:hypothetical protein [Litorihabitans aurantiacus]|nr:hypothetical protein [Litorihabitans aurantiacus]